MNVSPERVLCLAQRILEIQETQMNVLGVEVAEVGDIRIHRYENKDIKISYFRSREAVLLYNRSEDKIYLTKGCGRFLEDIIRQFGEVLPLEALAAIK